MSIETFLLAGAGVPFISGILATTLFGKKNDTIKTPGLLFHSILPDQIQPNLSCLSITRFNSIISHLKENNFNSITLSDAAVLNKPNSGSKEILITFDDGFQNVYDNAFEILQKANFKTSIFCVSDFTGKSSDWDVYGKSKHLNKISIRALSDAGHEIGSHTCTHAHLPYLSNADLYRELTESKNKLEEITGKQVTSLSFPHGGWTKRVWEKALEAGYTTATIYRNNSFIYPAGLFPVHGVYQFDTAESVLSRINSDSYVSTSRAISAIMPHFAKGTPVWKFRKNYKL
jgi:peptidoglycan/xylan/chitin deacetylase (PgdA/CDA1 family)